MEPRREQLLAKYEAQGLIKRRGPLGPHHGFNRPTQYSTAALAQDQRWYGHPGPSREGSGGGNAGAPVPAKQANKGGNSMLTLSHRTSMAAIDVSFLNRVIDAVPGTYVGSLCAAEPKPVVGYSVTVAPLAAVAATKNGNPIHLEVPVFGLTSEGLTENRAYSLAPLATYQTAAENRIMAAIEQSRVEAERIGIELPENIILPSAPVYDDALKRRVTAVPLAYEMRARYTFLRRQTQLHALIGHNAYRKMRRGGHTLNLPWTAYGAPGNFVEGAQRQQRPNRLAELGDKSNATFKGRYELYKALGLGDSGVVSADNPVGFFVPGDAGLLASCRFDSNPMAGNPFGVGLKPNFVVTVNELYDYSSTETAFKGAKAYTPNKATRMHWFVVSHDNAFRAFADPVAFLNSICN